MRMAKVVCAAYKQDLATQRLIEPSLKDAWLSGFIDAEGNFNIKPEWTNNRTVISGIKFRFELSQADESVIIKVRDLLRPDAEGKKNTHKSNSVYKLEISASPEKDILHEYLKKFPLKSHKRHVYEEWKKADEYYAKERERLKEASRALMLEIVKIGETLNKWRKIGKIKKEKI